MPENRNIKRARYTSRFIKKFTKLPPHIRKLYSQKEEFFLTNPYDPQLDTHKLSGKLGQFFAFRINQQYRVLFRFLTDDEVIIYHIGTHEIYKQ